ncbi:MAG TPA: methyltransferase domain-containing protein [Microthrixaceae bacterium]|jgi:ubiquinone/menaquinone biosynthesis C-methylase UbiE|nr:methyltransferase domain-containing protein [Microthrixaceae bacterium]
MAEANPMATLFDRLADTYDAVGVDFIAPIAEGLVLELDPQPGERALDVGCGKGAALVPLAAAVGATGTTVGIDISPAMVDRARSTLRDKALDATVIVGDADDPHVDSAHVDATQFDVITSSLVLFFLPDPATALMTWRSLMADDARVGVSTFGPVAERWRTHVDGPLRRWADANTRDARTTGQSGPFASDESMEGLFAEAGYHQVRTVTTMVSPRFADAEQWYRWSMSVGQRQFWDAVPADRLPQVRAELMSSVETCRDSDGRIGFDQAVRYTLAVR